MSITMIHKFNRQDISQTCLKKTRIPIYCTLILLASLISAPEEYRVDKDNILNQWFVKKGWGWTILLVLPFVLFNLKEDDKRGVSSTLFRLLLSSTLWFSSVNLFQLIDDITGFDISGHTFLLIFSNLMITSELAISREMEKPEKGGGLVKSHTDQLKESGVLKFALLALSFLWDFMLLQTALYYHTMIQKVIAAIWAIGSWYLLHILYYDEAQTRKTRPLH